MTSCGAPRTRCASCWASGCAALAAARGACAAAAPACSPPAACCHRQCLPPLLGLPLQCVPRDALASQHHTAEDLRHFQTLLEKIDASRQEGVFCGNLEASGALGLLVSRELLAAACKGPGGCAPRCGCSPAAPGTLGLRAQRQPDPLPTPTLPPAAEGADPARPGRRRQAAGRVLRCAGAGAVLRCAEVACRWCCWPAGAVQRRCGAAQQLPCLPHLGAAAPSLLCSPWPADLIEQLADSAEDMSPDMQAIHSQLEQCRWGAGAGRGASVSGGTCAAGCQRRPTGALPLVRCRHELEGLLRRQRTHEELRVVQVGRGRRPGGPCSAQASWLLLQPLLT